MGSCRNPTPEELQKGGPYELLFTLTHDDILPFVVKSLRRGTLVLRAYQALVLLSLLATIWSVAAAVGKHVLTWGDIALQLLVAIALNLTVVAFAHELVHGAVYKALGATNLVLKANWKQLLLYVTAPGFVVGRRAFTMVAVAPLVVISIALALLAALVPRIQPLALATLFIHATNCAGDVGLLSALCSLPYRRAYTYDDPILPLSYFYVER